MESRKEAGLESERGLRHRYDPVGLQKSEGS